NALQHKWQYQRKKQRHGGKRNAIVQTHPDALLVGRIRFNMAMVNVSSKPQGVKNEKRRKSAPSKEKCAQDAQQIARSVAQGAEHLKYHKRRFSGSGRRRSSRRARIF